jgi:hypothetical protein
VKNRIRGTIWPKLPPSLKFDGSIRWSGRLGVLILTAAFICGGVRAEPFSAGSEISSVNIQVGPELQVRLPDGSFETAIFSRDSLRLSGIGRLQNGMRLEFVGSTYLSHGWVPITIATFNTGEVLPGQWRLASTTGHQLVHASSLFGENDDAWVTSRGRYLHRFRSPFRRSNLKLPAANLLPEAIPNRTVIALGQNGLASIRVPAGCVDSSPLTETQDSAHVWRLDASRPVVIPEATGDPDPGNVNPNSTHSSDGALRRISRPESDRKFWRHQRLELAVPLENGLLVQGVRWPHLVSRSRTSGEFRQDLIPFELDDSTLRFLFRSTDGTVLSLEVSPSNRHFTVRLPDGRSRRVNVVPPFPLHSVIRVTLNDGLSISVNDNSIAVLNSSPGQLFALEAEGAFAAPGDTNDVRNRLPELPQPWVRHVDRSNKPTEPGRDILWHSLDADRVVLTSGDEIFGQVTEVTDEVTLQDPRALGQARRIDRRDLRAVAFRRPDSFAARSVDGFFSRIELVPDSSCSLAVVEEPFWMRTAIRQAEEDGLRTQHPILGDMLVRWKMIRRITPLFGGTYRLLDPGPRHLGNGYRESFRRVEPDGTEVKYGFEMAAEQLTQPTFLSADIAELIPSAPDTLKATPFLDDVRAGFLATQVFLNGELVGTFNELIRVRSPATDPKRVRLRLLARLLKAGGNAIEIRQTSSKDDSTSFDDFEIRAIAIEVENPVDFEE